MARPHNSTRMICEQIFCPDAARFCDNTGCIVRNRNKIRAQNFRKASQVHLCGVALYITFQNQHDPALFGLAQHLFDHALAQSPAGEHVPLLYGAVAFHTLLVVY